jgi:hypothetical protein
MNEPIFQNAVKAPNPNHLNLRVTLQNVVQDNELDIALEKARETLQNTVKNLTTFSADITFPINDLKQIIMRAHMYTCTNICHLRISAFGCYCEVDVANIYPNGVISEFRNAYSFQLIKD